MKFGIGSKIAAGNSLIIILLITIGFVGIISNNKSIESIDSISQESVPLVVASLEIDNHLTKSVLTLEEILSGSLPADEYPQFESHIQLALDYCYAILEGGTVDGLTIVSIEEEESRLIIESTINSINSMKVLADRRYNNLVSNKSASNSMIIAFDTSYENVVQELIGVENLAHQIMEEEIKEAKSSADTTRGQILFAIMISVIIAIGIYFLLNKMITKPIKGFVHMLKDIAEGEGDLTSRIQLNNKDEIGEMAKWFNIFTEKLQTIIINIQNDSTLVYESTEKVTDIITQSYDGIENISKSVESITDSTQTNASIIEEVNATTEEMYQQSDHSTKEVNSLKNNSLEIINLSEIGLEKVDKMVSINTMVTEATDHVQSSISDLQKSYEDIDTIVSIISGISDQTNLLALNASIEAARAGEQGKGFAVVADEVRKLAEASNESTNQIKNLILDIQQKSASAASSVSDAKTHVSTTVNESKEVKSQFVRISEILNKMNQQIISIYKNTASQSESTNEISKTMDEISIAIQNSADETQQITNETMDQLTGFDTIIGNINELKSISKNLKNNVDVFKTE